MLTLLTAVLTLTAQPEAAAPSMTGANPASPDAPIRIYRVAPPSGDDISERPGREGTLYRAGEVFTDTKLPIGYPRPTPPGAIEIKTYPSIRQAEVTGGGNGDRASRSGFWPLFQHISRNEIAMTAPVEMRYSDTDGDARTDQWTMAFLYHVPENGPTGTDDADGRVVVLDTEPVTVVSIGIQGGAFRAEGGEALEALEAWLDTADDWERAGDIRQLGYNGPNVPVRNRWWEIQIPIRHVDADGPDSGVPATDETI